MGNFNHRLSLSNLGMRLETFPLFSRCTAFVSLLCLIVSFPAWSSEEGEKEYAPSQTEV